jgi:hypothetical protein
VKTGGTLLTSIGQLAIQSVTEIDPSSLRKRDAERAGFDSLEALRAELARQRPGTLYRIEFRRAGDDPRIALRNNDRLSETELDGLVARLQRLDRHASYGQWTWRVLRAIHAHPKRRAGELAAQLRFEKEWFKLNVRKLKNLGLTESLHPGYRLSPRGLMLLDERGAENAD